MLLYNKAFDVNHTALRICTWLANSPSNEISIERIRIYDFLIAFPSHISKMALGKDLIKLRNEYKAFNNPYNSFNAQSLFHRMEGIQKSAIYSLLSLGLLNRESDSIYSFSKEEINRVFEINETSYTSINTEVINFIINTLEPMPFFGTHGIKAASKLLEYKYDRNETNT